MLSPDEAAGKLCPMARTFASSPAVSTCRGPECILWRWVPISSDHPAIRAVVSKEIERMGGGHLRHAAAVKAVMADPAAHGIPTQPTHGYCGLGGRSA